MIRESGDRSIDLRQLDNLFVTKRRLSMIFVLRSLFVVVILAGLSLVTARAEEGLQAKEVDEGKEVLQLPEVSVSGSRLPDVPVDIRTLPAKVTVITADDIRRSCAKTVQEAIQWATGIVMYDQVGNAFQQTVDLRGFSGQPVPATSVFVDGMRINEPDFNTVNFDLIPYET